ncbi:MAG: mechanosensitive ion channel family protein [Patescibacteria group bacterium]
MDFIFTNKLIFASGIVVAFWFGSYVVTILMTIIEKATSKTKTSLDDKIIKSLKLPIRIFSLLLGFFLAVKYIGLDWSWRNLNIDVLFFTLIVLLLGFTFSRLLKSFLNWYGAKEQRARKINQTMFVFIRKIISVFVYAIVLLIIFQHLGIQIGPLLAGLGVAGLAIALGLQETLANLFAALFLVMDKSINIGDWIQLEDGSKAYIEDISWRSVRIRTISGNTVIIPNSVFVGQKISSYDYPEKAFSTSVSVGVSYDTDLEKAEEVAIIAARNVIKKEKINTKDNEPIIRYKELADSSINFIVILKVDNAQDEGRIKHTLIKEIIKEFRQAKIEIPFPQRVIHQVG